MAGKRLLLILIGPRLCSSPGTFPGKTSVIRFVRSRNSGTLLPSNHRGWGKCAWPPGKRAARYFIWISRLRPNSRTFLSYAHSMEKEASRDQSGQLAGNPTPPLERGRLACRVADSPEGFRGIRFRNETRRDGEYADPGKG